ncbi:hypothetical protein HMPREF9163_01593 [Selenomonas sp. oral taxon 138 str. F0429]|nr:hypothetical protein HMPREF9163_01593 [Selenomonas sp. oral taxon 138 str. F0429]
MALTIVRASIIPFSRSSTDIARKISPPSIYALYSARNYCTYKYFDLYEKKPACWK